MMCSSISRAWPTPHRTRMSRHFIKSSTAPGQPASTDEAVRLEEHCGHSVAGMGFAREPLLALKTLKVPTFPDPVGEYCPDGDRIFRLLCVGREHSPVEAAQVFRHDVVESLVLK